jgi:regulator of protease activity HflC (stomatin/prohibitin superfamily)
MPIHEWRKGNAMNETWDSARKPSPLREIELDPPSGLNALTAILVVLAIALGSFIIGVVGQHPAMLILGIFLGIGCFVALPGLLIVNPNEARVLQLFGAYKGTVKSPGLRWANPFYSKRSVSLRVRNFESDKLKVNDQTGNPIMIAAVVVWKVIDTAEAIFHVDNYEHFVHVQSEAALRNLATSYPYDAHDDGVISLRSHIAEVAEHLKTEIQDRLTQAGVIVLEARFSHLAYAPEIAGVMLQRQQASAVIAARQKIVEGAVGMVEMALQMLSSKSIVELDNERKAAMVSNLLVVLCGDRGTQPMINMGTEAV